MKAVWAGESTTKVTVAEVTKTQPEWGHGIRACFEIVSASRKNPHDVLGVEADFADTAYLGYDPSGVLVSFFLVAWHRPSSVQPCIYLGLSGAREGFKGTKVTWPLYSALNSVACSWETLMARQLLLWFITPTMSAVIAAQQVFASVRPGGVDDLAASEDDVPTLDALAALFSSGTAVRSTHLVIGATRSRYKQSKVDRQVAAAQRSGRSLAAAGLDQANGDRLLCLARPRHVEK